MSLLPPGLGLRALKQGIHDLMCSGILATPPVRVRASPLRIVSLVSRRDFRMYLVAIKSFYAQMGEGEVFVVDDGSLTAEQKNLLRQHVPGSVLLNIADAPKRRVPKGGCWERLTFLLELGRKHYTIQLDADTLTRRPIPEILDALHHQRPFIMAGDRDGARIMSRADASRLAQVLPGRHIQTAMERKLADIEGLEPLYVRGCAAFFGLPPGSVSLEALEEWSDTMTAELGPRWSEWGTEQATVNYFLANLPATSVLAPPRYTHRWNPPPGEDSAFIHFIGTFRFAGQFYARQSRRTIRQLKNKAAGSAGAMTI